jgi:hypothetical protein
MPYFKIIIWFKNGKVRKGIRHFGQWNIEVAHLMIQNKVKTHYREYDLKGVDVYMLSKNSQEVKKLLSTLGKQK